VLRSLQVLKKPTKACNMKIKGAVAHQKENKKQLDVELEMNLVYSWCNF